MSRRNLLEGVIQGNSMIDFIPITARVTDIQTNLSDWISQWVLPGKEDELEVLSPKECFTRDHDFSGYTCNCDDLKETLLKSGYYVWSPPPAVT